MLLSHTQVAAPCSRRALSALPMLFTLGALAAMPAHAHEGHGMASSVHWHATDVLGFVVAAVAVVALVWWTRK